MYMYIYYQQKPYLHQGAQVATLAGLALAPPTPASTWRF